MHLLLKTQDANGRFSTYSVEEEFQGWDMWSRKYVLLGLIHYYEICKDETMKAKVLAAEERHLTYIIAHVEKEEGKKSITQTSKLWRGINSSSILEPVVRLYTLTGNHNYLDFAGYIVSNGGAEGFNIFEAAYEDKLYPYQYPVVKAYELMSCFEGLIEYFNVTGISKWRVAAHNFMDKLLESEAMIVGGSGCRHELFNHSSLMQTYTKSDGILLETCVTVTWMKLLYRVYLLTGDPKYMDAFEVSAYNALLGSVNTENATCGPETTFDEPRYREVYDRYVNARNGEGQIFDSYSPLRADIRGRAVGGFKAMDENRAYCGCCVAIGAAGMALMPLASAECKEDKLSMTMYFPGSIHTQIGDTAVELKILTAYPGTGDISIDIYPEQEILFSMSLRIPKFSTATQVNVNGEPVKKCVEAGKFFTIERFWKKGDTIRLTLDMNPRLRFGEENEDDPQSKDHVAVLYGPLALARDKRLGAEDTPVIVKNGQLSLQTTRHIPFLCQCAFDVTIDGKTFPMVDYASAGKTWRRDSEMEVWMKKGRP